MTIANTVAAGLGIVMLTPLRKALGYVGHGLLIFAGLVVACLLALAVMVVIGYGLAALHAIALRRAPRRKLRPTRQLERYKLPKRWTPVRRDLPDIWRD